MAIGGELNMGAYRRVKPTKEQAAIAESNRRFLERRDAGLSDEERAAAADAEAARRNNGRNPGGRMSDDQWIDTKWDDAMRQQRIDDAVKRRRDNAAYRATLDKAQANVESGISESRDRQMRANLAGFDKAFAGNGMVPMSVIDTLAGEMSETGVRYAGGRFFDGKNGDRTFVSVGLTKDGQKVYNRMSLIDALREDTRLGGGNLSDKTRDGIVAALRKRGMTDEQIERASGYSQRVEDEIRARYAETARPEGDGNPDSITNRITGGAGGREVGSTTDGKAMSRIAGRVPSRHSRISFFGTSGRPGDGWSERVYDGHTGEDTGFVNHGARAEEEADRAAERAAKIAAGRRSGLSAEDRIAIENVKNKNAMERDSAKEHGKDARQAERLAARQKELETRMATWKEIAEKRGGKSKDAFDRINEAMRTRATLVNSSKYSNSGAIEVIDAMIDDLSNEIESSNQAPIKPGDNTGDETQIPEFDPNKKDYKAGDHFVRNGIEYEVGSDGQPHKVSK